MYGYFNFNLTIKKQLFELLISRKKSYLFEDLIWKSIWMPFCS